MRRDGQPAQLWAALFRSRLSDLRAACLVDRCGSERLVVGGAAAGEEGQQDEREITHAPKLILKACKRHGDSPSQKAYRKSEVALRGLATREQAFSSLFLHVLRARPSELYAQILSLEARLKNSAERPL